MNFNGLWLSRGIGVIMSVITCYPIVTSHGLSAVFNPGAGAGEPQNWRKHANRVPCRNESQNSDRGT